MNHQTGFENNRVRDHGIVDGVRVFGSIEVLLDDPAGVGEKEPVGPDARAIFVDLGDIVRAVVTNRQYPTSSSRWSATSPSACLRS